MTVGSAAPGAFAISDVTDSQSFTETVPYTSTEDTAEWIEETPVVIDTTVGAGISALPDLSTVGFSAATASGKGAGLVPAEAIQLVTSSGTPIATPSGPGATGAAFDDCTYATTCAAP